MKNPPREARGASNRLAGQFESSTPNNLQSQSDDDGQEWARNLALAAANWLCDRRRCR